MLDKGLKGPRKAIFGSQSNMFPVSTVTNRRNDLFYVCLKLSLHECSVDSHLFVQPLSNGSVKDATWNSNSALLVLIAPSVFAWPATFIFVLE
ncbi:hypothetical protein J6590_067296 [Homalodisca vitripennis]|nr:hypothetical protein J6590_067296 [Homalodisca vitripennis]